MQRDKGTPHCGPEFRTRRCRTERRRWNLRLGSSISPPDRAIAPPSDYTTPHASSLSITVSSPLARRLLPFLGEPAAAFPIRLVFALPVLAAIRPRPSVNKLTLRSRHESSPNASSRLCDAVEVRRRRQAQQNPGQTAVDEDEPSRFPTPGTQAGRGRSAGYVQEQGCRCGRGKSVGAGISVLRFRISVAMKETACYFARIDANQREHGDKLCRLQRLKR